MRASWCLVYVGQDPWPIDLDPRRMMSDLGFRFEVDKDACVITLKTAEEQNAVIAYLKGKGYPAEGW